MNPKIYIVVATGGDYEEAWWSTVCWFNYRKDAEVELARLTEENKIFSAKHREWQLRMYAYQNGYEEANPRPKYTPKPTLVSQAEWVYDQRYIVTQNWWDTKFDASKEWLANDPEPKGEWEQLTSFHVEELKHG